MYVKLIDRHTVESWRPPVLKTQGRTYVHPKEDVLRAAGYLPLTVEPAPPGTRFVYTEENGCVVAHALRDDGEVSPDA